MPPAPHLHVTQWLPNPLHSAPNYFPQTIPLHPFLNPFIIPHPQSHCSPRRPHPYPRSLRLLSLQPYPHRNTARPSPHTSLHRGHFHFVVHRASPGRHCIPMQEARRGTDHARCSQGSWNGEAVVASEYNGAGAGRGCRDRCAVWDARRRDV
jgi:hypothetical protein